MINLLIVDDHDLVRLGIKSLLDDIDGIEVIAEASSGEQALDLVKDLPIDVILMDVKMPGIGGIEATRRLLRYDPDIKIIAVTACLEDPFPTRLLDAGAVGYITKEASIDEMVLAIRKIHAGQRYISTEIAQALAFKSDRDASPFDSLSEREMQIAIMLVNGDKLGKIAEQLNISSKTVSSYRSRVLQKLKCETDVDLVLMALRYGVIEPGIAVAPE